MKTPRLVTFVLSLWIISCLSIAQPSAIPSEPIPDVTATLEDFPTSTSAPTPVAVGTNETGSFELIGHSPLLNRGMNAAIAVYGNYVYIGSRTDGGHPDAGVLVVDISNPANPQVLYQIGPPDEGLPGQTSRELRIWPEQELLIVMNVACSPVLHDCQQPGAAPNLSFYDISAAHAAEPRLLAVYPMPLTPHEFFFWDDPQREGRGLLYLSTPGRLHSNLLVLDISQARQGFFELVSHWNAPFGQADAELHSLSVSVDGRRAYLAHLQDGLMVLDTSDLAENVADAQIVLLTPARYWARLPAGAHSAVKLFGKPYVLVTEEVYGRCPWGWTHLIDITDETQPKFTSEFKLNPFNSAEHCAETTTERYRYTSFSSHNPTVTKNLAFITWHSGGLWAVSIADPLQPSAIAQFLPEPLTSVGTEDPALSSGPDKVVMWSYPIIKDGLIYVVDVRNGLYILKYHGPYDEEVSTTVFLEGNSNLGDARSMDAP